MSNSLSSAFVIVYLRMPGAACQAALYEIYPLAYGTKDLIVFIYLSIFTMAGGSNIDVDTYSVYCLSQTK